MTTNDEDVICAPAEATNIPSLDTTRESAQWSQNDAASDGGSVSGTRGRSTSRRMRPWTTCWRVVARASPRIRVG